VLRDEVGSIATGSTDKAGKKDSLV
jgi:hypothetical protein